MGVLPYGYDFTSGFPSGRIGFYTDVADAKLLVLNSSQEAGIPIGPRWRSHCDYLNNYIDSDQLYVYGGYGAPDYPTILQGLRMERFQVTFSTEDGDGFAKFLFDVQDKDNYDFVTLQIDSTFGSTGVYESYEVVDGKYDSYVSYGTSNTISTSNGDRVWYRADYNGTTLTIKALVDNSGTPTDTDWSSATTVFDSTHYNITGGSIGFAGYDDSNLKIDNLVIKNDADSNGSYETTEYEDDFDADANGRIASDPDHDKAGNVTFDGTYKYTYDAWDRCVKVERAYRDPSETIQTGSVVCEVEHDGLNRRIVQQVKNSADLDATYHYYCTGSQVIEVRNGSDDVLKQYVWGGLYIDELIEVGINDDPTDGTEDNVESFYFAQHDASFNVIGLTDGDGDLVERYFYSPYGDRQVFHSAGTNDPSAHTRTQLSQRVTISSVDQPYGLCEIGFQGLMHDEGLPVFGGQLICNRARMLHPRMGRFIQRDPLGYVDGTNLYGAYHVMRGGLDPMGEAAKKTYAGSKKAMYDEIAAFQSHSASAHNKKKTKAKYFKKHKKAELDNAVFQPDKVDAFTNVIEFQTGVLSGTAGAMLLARDISQQIARGDVQITTVFAVFAKAKGGSRGFAKNAASQCRQNSPSRGAARSGASNNAAQEILEQFKQAGLGSSGDDFANDIVAAALGGAGKNKALSMNLDRATAQLVHQLRQVGTAESIAVAALIKRGKLDIRLSTTDKIVWQQGQKVFVRGQYMPGTNTIIIYRRGLSSVEKAAGVVAHESKHFLQKAGTSLNPYHQGLEYPKTPKPQNPFYKLQLTNIPDYYVYAHNLVYSIAL